MFKMRDYVTGAELTESNFIRCLNGYLETVVIVDKDIAENLLCYVERALKLGGVKLANAAINAIRVDLLSRNF